MRLSDSHCHLKMTGEQTKCLPDILQAMQEKDFRFVLDIGTMPGDLSERMAAVRSAFSESVPEFLHFSAGLWPHLDSIRNSKTSLAALEGNIVEALKNKPSFFALGECGLDRHWNGMAGLMQAEGGDFVSEGEEEDFFIAQLEMAKKYGLAVIIHSRDAAADTLKCIDYVNYHCGVMHCYSYGIEELQSFIERNWYISLSGTITYAKTAAKRSAAAALIRAIPDELLLLETDSPYLSPAPLRGKKNTPLHIAHTYAFVAEHRGMSVEELSDVVYENCCRLFTIRPSG